MKLPFPHPLLIAILGSCLACLAQDGDLVDRIVAVVNGRIITQSDLQESRRWLSSKNPSNRSSEAGAENQEVLKAYMERLLLGLEIDNYPGLEVPDEEIEVQWKALLEREPALRARMQGQEASKIRAEIREQLLYEKYIDIRFRNFIEISPEEIEKYYQDRFLAEWRSASDKEAPSIAAVREQIRPILVEIRIQEQLDRWMEELKQKAEILILPEKFRFLPASRDRNYPVLPQKPKE